jgi:hypothetical protein
MLVIAHHFIQNPEEFWNLAQQVTPSLPSHLKLHSVFPSEDLKTGTCVWESSGVAEVQEYLDKTLGHVSKNVCYAVKEDMAIGLPQKTMEKAFS